MPIASPTAPGAPIELRRIEHVAIQPCPRQPLCPGRIPNRHRPELFCAGGQPQRRSSRIRMSVTFRFKPGDCLAKPVHEVVPSPSERPVTVISISSNANTPGGPDSTRLADRVALNLSPSCYRFPMQENVVSPPLSSPPGPKSTTPAPSPIGVLNQIEYLPSVINPIHSGPVTAATPVPAAA
jgi:hypothetical protein